MWRNKLTGGKPWQWGKWSAIAKPKSQGGLGILDPVVHSMALCAKLFCALATSEESWAYMAREMVMGTTMSSKGGNWHNLSLQNRLLPPTGVKAKLGGFTGKFIEKFSKAAETLMWKEEVRYWKGTAGHWSPWGPILVGLGLYDHWIEVARGINYKGFNTLDSLTPY